MTTRPDTTAERMIDAYLGDLERALSGLEPDERDEVVTSVREHIDAAIRDAGGQVTADNVEAVLRDLGPVEQIARDADAPMGDRTPSDEPQREGWLLVALALLSLPLLVNPFIAVPLALGVATAAGVATRRSSGRVRRRYQLALSTSLATVCIAGVLALLLLPTSNAGPTPDGPPVNIPAETAPVDGND